jgi:FAD/FMN-containing dehydrogenase
MMFSVGSDSDSGLASIKQSNRTVTLGARVNPKELQSRIEGTVTSSTDPRYEGLRRSMVWNQLAPDRRPRYIVQAASESDVVESVRFARSNQLKVAVRGGGHSWVGFSLRDDSLLIDLGRLKQASINPEARLAIVQPAITGRALNRMLNASGLAFPVGHCPTVPVSGFLLNGGLGWNCNTWGPSCFSVERARVVAADGDLTVATDEQHSDLLWAIRGGGPGFFGAVTEYTLKLYSAPRSILTSYYYYPLERIEEIGQWADGIARELPRQVELTIFITSAPPSISDQCKSSNGFVCIVSGTAFADSATAGASMLEPLGTCPASGSCLVKEPEVETTIDDLHDKGALLWPERHRYLADTLWIDSSPGKVLATSRDHFLHAASSKSLQVLVFSTGERLPLADGAYSMTGDALLLCYAIWERPEDDAANIAWHTATIAALDKYAVGHYVGESDIVAAPDRAVHSYMPANWERLNALRQKYDPEGLFHGHFKSPELLLK